MQRDLIVFRNVAGEPMILNMELITSARWIERKSRGPDGQPVSLVGTRALAIACGEVMQGNSITHLVHPADSEWVWDYMFGRAVGPTRAAEGNE